MIIKRTNNCISIQSNMASTLRNDVDFSALFKKLGHHLDEIRVRALENILSKLEHRLICDSDLVQERHLFIRLLEWFNFPKSSRQADVLNLILRLSKHTTGAEVIQEIGGIEFLTTLRKDVSASLQPVIDQILENAMRLPDIQVGEPDHAPACIYQRHNHTGMTGGMETTVDSRHTHDPAATSLASTRPPTENPGDQRLPDYREPPLGFFEGEPEMATSTQAEQQVQRAEMLYDSSSSCFRMTIFPWLALTPTDRSVIMSTNSSLQSKDPTLLISTCEFLSDVIFQDFPSEIFLQRPNIVKNLLSLLCGPAQDLGRPRVAAIRSLADFAVCLRTKIRCHQDPNLYTAKQDFSTTTSPFSTPSSSSTGNHGNDGRPDVIGWTDTRHRGDGRDGDSSASSTGTSRASSVGLSPGPEPEQTDFEDMPSLQYIQMTVPQFCLAVLEKALPLMKTTDETMATEVLHLLNQVLDIVVAVVTPALWDDSSMAARECVDKFTESFDLLADLLKYHHHSNVPFDFDETDLPCPTDLVQHRLAYIGLSCLLNRLLTVLVPVEKSRGVIPETLLAAINLLVYDVPLCDSQPGLQATLLTYIAFLDDGRHDVHTQTAAICHSLRSTCRFMELAQEEASRLSKETLAACEGAFASLPYHSHMNYITEVVNLCSIICSKSQHYDSLQAQYRKLLLNLLSHPLHRIRQQAFADVFQQIQKHLSVAKAMDPAATSSCERVKFVIHADILYEIVLFGLADKDAKVCNTATELMAHLMKSQLLMSPELWQHFLQCLLRSLPVLQSYAGLTSVLGTSVLAMLDTRNSGSPNELPVLEKFRGTLRCMLSSDLKVRSDALKRLSWYLSNEEGSSKKLPVFSELDVTNLANLLVVDTPRSVEEELGRSVFQVDGLRKVYEIFTSLSVDPSVKKSAVDQLAIILQDPTLHSAFRKDGGFEKILEHLQLGVLKDGESSTNSNVQYLPGCMAVLRFLVHHDYSLRHKLARDANIYHNLLRVALLHSRDERTCYEVAHVLTLLLFDEQARFFMGGTKNTAFSVPVVVKQRYRLPFRPSVHYEKSPYECLAPREPDPLMTELPLGMMRLSWNVAWHGGMDGLLKAIDSQHRDDKDTMYSPKLVLTPLDKVILQTSHVRHGLQYAVYAVTNATSHYSVSRSLTRLLSHTVARNNAEVLQVLHTLDWCGAIARFVKIIPSSSADESLLLDILRFISLVLKLTNRVPDNILQWIGEVLYHPKGPLIGLLHRQSAREAPEEATESLVNIKRSLDKSLLAFIANYNSSLPYVLTVRLKFHQLRGDLAHRLLQRLNVTDAPHFYNLASLEGTLQCLMHITARPGWSQECTDITGNQLCNQVLNSLLEVVSAFHIGRGETAMSYMGKGVTKAATLCLRHIAYEMATLATDEKWAKSWLYSRHGNDAAEEPGLDWMLTLWAYRDPEVRAAGLGIGVTLSCTEEGRLLLTTNCKHIPGGIWAAAFSILLDQAECSMVRQQAALLLVNLTSESLPSGSTEMEQRMWQGPVVMDTEFQVSLVGLTALLALLHHCQFYREMTVMLSSYYPQPTIQPAVASEVYQLSASASENTLSALADAGIEQGQGRSVFMSHQNTMSLLQSTGLSSGQMSERPGAVGANGQPLVQRTPINSNRSTPSAGDRGRRDQEGQAGEVTEYQSVTTPCLVSAVSQLVRNFIIQAPKDTVTALKNESLIPFFVSMIDANFLGGIQALTSCDERELFFTELVEMHVSIVRLLQTCLVHDSATRMTILNDKVALGGIVSLLRIFSNASPDTYSLCCELWKSVLSFLSVLVQMQCGPAVEVLAEVLQKQWLPIAGNLQKILDGDYTDRQLYVQCLHLLSIMCSEDGKLTASQSPDNTHVTITKLLNQPLQHDCEDKDGGQITAGSRFCKALVGALDQCILRKTDNSASGERIHVITSLKCLLAVSETSKTTALELGLVENLLEHVKQAHARLNMATLQPGKMRDDGILQDLTLTLDLLRNFMYNNTDVKMACYHSGLQNIVHKLWSWCQMDPGLMHCVISLLISFTAVCPTATSSLAYTSPASSTTSQVKPGLSSNSMVHCIIKHVGREKHKEAIMRGLYGLLANLALSSECRNIIWKSNFLREFSELNPKKSKNIKVKGKQLLVEVLWLELLLNLSFSLEGQQMILKIPDAIDLLLEFIECPHARQRECALIIVRNLCCHSSNKPKVLANDKLLPQLLKCVDSCDGKLQTVAVSGLWALVYNNQKAKVEMKNANVLPKLQEVLGKCDDSGGVENEKLVMDLQSVIQTVSE